MRTISKFTTILAVVAGVGLLAGAAQAAFNWNDPTPRPIFLENEGVTGVTCQNLYTNPPLPPVCNPALPCGLAPPNCRCHPNNRAPDPQ